MFKLRNASSNTQVRRHGFGKRVSRENGTTKLVKAAFRQCSSTPRLFRSASCTVTATLTAGNTCTVNPSFQLHFAGKKMQILRLFIPSQVNFYIISIWVDLTELKILCICKLYFVICYFRYTILFPTQCMQ